MAESPSNNVPNEDAAATVKPAATAPSGSAGAVPALRLSASDRTADRAPPPVRSPSSGRLAQMFSPRNLFKKKEKMSSASLDEDALRALRDALPEGSASADTRNRSPASPSLRTTMSMDEGGLQRIQERRKKMLASAEATASPTASVSDDRRQRVLSFGSAHMVQYDADCSPATPRTFTHVPLQEDKFKLERIVLEGEMLINQKPMYGVIRGNSLRFTTADAILMTRPGTKPPEDTAAVVAAAKQHTVFLPNMKVVLADGSTVTQPSAIPALSKEGPPHTIALVPKNERVQKLWRLQLATGAQFVDWMTVVLQLTTKRPGLQRNSASDTATPAATSPAAYSSATAPTALVSPRPDSSPRRATSKVLREYTVSPRDLAKMNDVELANVAEQISSRGSVLLETSGFEDGSSDGDDDDDEEDDLGGSAAEPNIDQMNGPDDARAHGAVALPPSALIRSFSPRSSASAAAHVLAGHRSPRTSGRASSPRSMSPVSTVMASAHAAGATSPRITPRSSTVAWLPATPRDDEAKSGACERCGKSKAQATVTFEQTKRKRLLCRSCISELGGPGREAEAAAAAAAAEVDQQLNDYFAH